MNENSENSVIIIKCDKLTLEVNRSVLIKESGYFRALMEGTYADSANVEHTIHPEMVEPKLLLFMVEWLVKGEPTDLHDWTMDAIMRSAEACEVLQMENISRRLWEVAISKLNPDHCILDAKRCYTLSSGAADFMKVLWNSIQWQFFELVWCEETLSELTEAELYWILRNPNIVEPTGGVLALILIDVYVRHHFPNFGDSVEDSGCSSEEAMSMTARLVFALLESIEARVRADPPANFVQRALLPRLCDSDCTQCLKNEISVSEKENLHATSSAASLLNIREGANTTVPPSLSLPLMHKDFQIIHRNQEDNNVFRLMYNTRKKTPWKACFVDRTHFGRPVSMKIPTGPPPPLPPPDAGAPLWTYDEDSRSFMPEMSKLSIPCGARLCVYGFDLLVVGGEENYIGSNKFCRHVQRYCLLSKRWTRLNLSEPLRHRSFIFCWLASKGLLLQGGYTQFRQHYHKLKLLGESSDHTFKYHEALTLESAELPRLPSRMTVSDETMLFTSGDHVCVIDRANLVTFCPVAHAWNGCFRLRANIEPSVGPFVGAFAYGTGVYVIAFDRKVFFVPLTVRVRNPRNTTEETMQFHNNGLRMFLYSRFKSCGSQLCRVQDKLYLSGQQTDDQPPVVEVLPLRYDPLEPEPSLASARLPDSECAASSCSSSLSSATSSSAAKFPWQHSGSNGEQPSVSKARQTDQEHGEELHRRTLTNRSTGGAWVEGCTSPVHDSVAGPHAPVQSTNVWHRSTPVHLRVVPDVLPTAAAVRRVAAAQHKLLDDAVLQSITRVFGSARTLTPAGNYADLLVKEMKSNFYPNWVISDPEFCLRKEDRSSTRENFCAWCYKLRRVSTFTDTQNCSRLCDTYVERPKFVPPLVPLPGCNAFTILKT